MLEELLDFIHSNFAVDPATGRVTKPDGRLFTAARFQGLPLTAKEVVWVYSQRQLPVGILLRNPDRLTHKFALNNLERYDESEEERKVYRNPIGFRLAWRYREKEPPVMVELAEYQTITSIVRISPMNFRYSEIGLKEEEVQRRKRTKNALHRTNLKENTLWKIMTDDLCLVKGSKEIVVGRWMGRARGHQTYSHKEMQDTRIHSFTSVKVRAPRPNKKRGIYARERIAESQAILEARDAEEKARQLKSLRITAKDSPILQYTEEVLFPSLQKETFLLDMAKWISHNSL